MTFVDLDRRDVAQLAGERARAEAAAQSAAVEAPPAVVAAEPAEPEETITPAAHAASVEMLCSLMVLAGGREVPAHKRALATQLTFQAAKKYGGEIPYFVELCAVGGLAVIVREAFFVRDEEQQDQEQAEQPKRRAA